MTAISKRLQGNAQQAFGTRLFCVAAVLKKNMSRVFPRREKSATES
jgi:hypothetical protein